MSFNVAKCHTLKVHRKKNPDTSQYTMDNIPVTKVDHHPYLGVELEQDMSWQHHISDITSKASSTLGLLKRNFSSCSTAVKSAAHRTLVRPKLEYASAAYHVGKK